MNRSSRTAAAGLAAAGMVAGAWMVSGPPAAADEDARSARGRVLWGAVTIPPGQEAVIEIAGVTATPPGDGFTLTLTAPDGTRVTGLPLDGSGYTGILAPSGRSASYTAGSGAAAGAAPGGDAAAGASASAPVPAEGASQERTFPFVLAVPRDARPGSTPGGCTLRLTDARGVTRAAGGCRVTVGLGEPTLTRPESGVPLDARPEIAGTAHPGAQVTVLDGDDTEVCSATAGPDGLWTCTPGLPLAPGGHRLQAAATLNGVSADSQQIAVTVGAAETQASPAPPPRG
ncbi:carboxypeptidase regulatory-like domain-containing protein [Streptomyces sp. enrichment culture]|uniref:carboxypeptidase regulatory-like domain-containing protein n=1 Tax=Streptomyces sp. enrichment culture TaxID=1795815 RepID=UPI003F57994F